ncbi:hypothetical protein FBD94_11910 [Pedobacter hiemivivus]|uniref:PH domain-containing protein n=1 Tax=Pedobacter hiemivivus TaxID=2530454 RepID=A0A4U1GEN1_9SPHI|nr:hypothetical protein [Pedobacter hiemivivus]TKC61243.1 hypothetical protein FBD94_11910 [Pedobacter hiemivivus]
MKFTASRLSEGNKVFPTEIHLEENSIEIKSPGLFCGDSKYLNYEDITSIEVDSPMIGFSTLRLFLTGNKIEISGFSKSDIKQIRQIIEEAKNKRRKS